MSTANNLFFQEPRSSLVSCLTTLTHGLAQRSYAVDLDPADGRRLRRIALRQNQPPKTLAPRAFGHRERAPDSPQPPVERELSDHPGECCKDYGRGAFIASSLLYSSNGLVIRVL